MPDPELVLYFDGNCPFCAAEMARLKRWDASARLGFVDISLPGFDPTPLGVELAALGRELHSKRADGTVLVGIDSMLAAYTLAGKGALVWPLRVHLLRPALAWLYRGFAARRYRFSRWLGYRPRPRCDGVHCNTGNPFLR